MKKLGSNTKTLVLAVIVNMISFGLIPSVIIEAAYLYLEQNLDSLPMEVYRFEDTLTLIVGLVMCFMLSVCVIVWSKIFTYDKIPLGKTKKSHSSWICLLCLISAYAGFWLSSRIFGFVNL